MKTFEKGRFRVRLAQTEADVRAVQALRHLAFFGARGQDADRFDDACDHVLVERLRDGRIVASFRMLPLQNGRAISESYSAQFYDLSALHAYDGPMVELGRFCTDPAEADPEAVRAAWAAMTRYVDENNIKMLFGCSSFQGVSEAPYLDAFAWLKAYHLAPEHWGPKPKGAEIFEFAEKVNLCPEAKRAMKQMPRLLKTYLVMGGWVSDHAVIDREMQTLHVFTGVEVDAIPPVRQRLLRDSASETA